jgi:hypothetical protein
MLLQGLSRSEEVPADPIRGERGSQLPRWLLTQLLRVLIKREESA